MENDKQKTISASKSVFEKTEGGMVRERALSAGFYCCSAKNLYNANRSGGERLSYDLWTMRKKIKGFGKH